MRLVSGKSNRKIEWRIRKRILRGNGIEVHQVQTGRTQQDRQEKNGLYQPMLKGGKMIQRGMSHQGILLLHPPTEDRLFTDWSNRDSPRERTSQCDVSARNTELNIIQTDNQTDQPG